MVKSPLAAIRAVVAPEPDPEKPGRSVARLESTGEVIVASTRQPLVDGARELLAGGFDPATPLTMRHEGKAYDSFQPLPIGKWAKWTYKEGEKDALRRTAWMPLPTDRGWQKSGSEPCWYLRAGRRRIASTADRHTAVSGGVQSPLLSWIGWHDHELQAEIRQAR
jgi:hypothetical protein